VCPTIQIFIRLLQIQHLVEVIFITNINTSSPYALSRLYNQTYDYEDKLVEYDYEDKLVESDISDSINHKQMDLEEISSRVLDIYDKTKLKEVLSNCFGLNK